MKTLSTLQPAHSAEHVAAQEMELKSLLSRVMETPLAPLLQRLGALDTRLDVLEEMCLESRDLTHSVHADIAEQKNATERTLRGMQKSGEELRSSLQDGFAGITSSVSGGISSMSSIGHGISRDVGQLRDALGGIDEELKRAAIGVDAVVPAQQGNAQQLKEELLQFHSRHDERLDRLQGAFQRKFTLLALACGIIALANIVLLVVVLR